MLVMRQVCEVAIARRSKCGVSERLVRASFEMRVHQTDQLWLYGSQTDILAKWGLQAHSQEGDVRQEALVMLFLYPLFALRLCLRLGVW